jgi:hypothetical protein
VATPLAQAHSHYNRLQRVTLAAVKAVRAAMKATHEPARIAAVVGSYQFASATIGSRGIASAAGADQALVNPVPFAGWTAAGFPLTDPLAEILAEIDTATEALLSDIDRFVASEVADAGRSASQAEIVSRPNWTNYVRVLNPPSCTRCAILAGRIYRDLEGFERHPLCDCQHWPVTSWEQAHDEGLIFSANDAFEKGQIHGLSVADAQAITDGADIAQVVNAHRGMATADIFGHSRVKVTSAGTTKRSAWRKANPNRPYRLRPEAIYDIAADREEVLRLLRLYGYLI